MTKRKRWQIVSDDSVWMYPADVTLSTVELTSLKLGGLTIYEGTPYETCIFFANGDSDVLARYKTQEEAIAGHVELEKKYGLKRCLKSKMLNL